MSDTIKGYIQMPFRGESAYEIALRYGYKGTEEEWIRESGAIGRNEILTNVAKRLCGHTWYVDSDSVCDREGNLYGTLANCMTDDFTGSWFYVRTTASEAGSTAYDSKYIIDGANGYLSLRDYVVWTGTRLVHIPTFEAKASDKKNSDGKYSPKGCLDGLMSSTDKAYLSDLINAYWKKDKLDVFNTPDPAEGWQTNWLFNTGVYLGGIKKDCGGHPPVVNDNHTSWVIMVFNGMATDAQSLNRNHRVQIAFDVVNSKIYMRRGWMSANTWADAWSEVGSQIVESKSDIVFVEDTTTLKLDENIKEIVAKGVLDLNIWLPEKTWCGWSCVINLSELSTIENFDVGTSNGDMFGFDFSHDILAPGKTYVIAKSSGGQSENPSLYTLYEVDNITRQPV